MTVSKHNDIDQTRALLRQPNNKQLLQLLYYTAAKHALGGTQFNPTHPIQLNST